MTRSCCTAERGPPIKQKKAKTRTKRYHTNKLKKDAGRQASVQGRVGVRSRA